MDPLPWSGSGARRYAVRPFCFLGRLVLPRSVFSSSFSLFSFSAFILSYSGFVFLEYVLCSGRVVLPHTCRVISAPLACSIWSGCFWEKRKEGWVMGASHAAAGQGMAVSTFVPLYLMVRRLATGLYTMRPHILTAS